MKHRSAVVWLFAVAALYDGLLGLAFLVMPGAVFDFYRVTPPNHMGYVQFPAAVLVIFAIMFAMVARAPIRNRNLIPYGMLLKLAYCAVVLRYWASGGIPGMWKPFAIADALFFVLFGVVYAGLGRVDPRTA